MRSPGLLALRLQYETSVLDTETCRASWAFCWLLGEASTALAQGQTPGLTAVLGCKAPAQRQLACGNDVDGVSTAEGKGRREVCVREGAPAAIWDAEAAARAPGSGLLLGLSSRRGRGTSIWRLPMQTGRPSRVVGPCHHHGSYIPSPRSAAFTCSPITGNVFFLCEV